MSESTASDTPQDTGAPRLAGWQKTLAIGSVVFTVGGLALMAVSALTGDTTAAETATSMDGELVTSLTGSTGEAGSGETADPTFLDEWSPTIFKLGFSFFAAFCIAYALRSFVKIAIIAMGLLLIALFGLQYFDLIDVNWSEWSSRYDSVSAWISEQTNSFRAFIQGALPSSASAAVGFIAGFRRRR